MNKIITPIVQYKENLNGVEFGHQGTLGCLPLKVRPMSFNLAFMIFIVFAHYIFFHYE